MPGGSSAATTERIIFSDERNTPEEQKILYAEPVHSFNIVEETAQKIGPESFVAHQLLGTGSFGEVFLVERITDKKLFAMKVLNKAKIKQQNLIKYVITERNVMATMNHPFIVRLRYSFQT